jgi:hypothetical protein
VKVKPCPANDPLRHEASPLTPALPLVCVVARAAGCTSKPSHILAGFRKPFVWTTCAKVFLKPDIYDPQLNPLYAAMLHHYGVVALPCRPYAPDLNVLETLTA